MLIPTLVQEVKEIREANLKKKLDLMRCFDLNTMVTLTNENQFSHLQYPFLEEVWVVSKNTHPAEEKQMSQKFPFFSIILGYYGKELPVRK